MAGSCGPCRSVRVCWWVGSVCPGWLAGAGFLRAAWSPGRPAWPPAELRTTAAKSDRQVERQTELNWGVGGGGGVESRDSKKRRKGGGEEKGDMNKWILESAQTKKKTPAKKLWKKRPLVARPLFVWQREIERDISTVSPLPHPLGEALTASLTGPEMAMSPPGASWEKGKTFRLSRSRRRAWLSLKVKKSDDGEGKKREGEGNLRSYMPDGTCQKCLVPLRCF